MAKRNKQHCPCGTRHEYLECCGRFIERGERPATPEQLMRSRYTAYTQMNEAYLLDTWHSSTRPASLSLENQLPIKWVDMRVLNHSQPSETDTTATVEFVARYKVGGKAEKMHEVSEFIKEDGRWYYLKGKVD